MGDKYCKTIGIAYGEAEGYDWQLNLTVCPLSRIFQGRFCLTSEERKRKHQIRDKDRQWFKRNLGDFMTGKEIHHRWSEGGTCFILSPKEHKEVTRWE